MEDLRKQWKRKAEKALPERANIFRRAAEWMPVFEGTTVRFIRKTSQNSEQPIAKTTQNEIKEGGPAFGLTKRFSSGLIAGALAVLLVSTPLILAFEAHVINVTATLVQIDPPTILPPVLQCSADAQITIDDADPDATHIFYTITPGTDPNVAPDPVCGGTGGPKPIGPLAITDDSVVKAIACDGPTGAAHASVVSTVVYDLSCFGKIEGRKFNDVNGNEAFDDGIDTPVAGWRIDLLVASTVVMTTLTDSTGYYTFNNLAPDDYAVEEESRPNWIHITPKLAFVTINTDETEVVNFLNFDTGFQCAPQDIIFPLSVAVQAAGLTSGNDDIAVASNVTINGSVRSNDELERIGSSAVTRTVNGNAVVVNTVDTGFLITSGIVSGPATTLTAIDQANWKGKAAQGGVVNGSFVFPNGTVGLSLGPTEIMGNLIFGESNSATLNGPIYIHGDLTIGTSTSLIQDSGFGNAFVTIIVDGKVTIHPGAVFIGSGTQGTILIVSNAAAIAGDGAAINVIAGASDIGDALLYAGAGDIHVGANRTVLALFAAKGTGADMDANAAVRIDSGVSVNYHDLPTQISCGEIQPFQTTSHILINEFMPNPTLDKVGVLGAPLDGEWVELYNPTASPIDVAGYFIYDDTNTNELPITALNTDTGGTVVPALGRIVVYRDGDDDFALDVVGGDTVRLLTGDIGSGGVQVDMHDYTADAPINKSFARIPDGTANWIDPDATPGAPNTFFFEPILALPDGAPLSVIPVKPAILIEQGAEEEIPVSVAPDNTTPPEPFVVEEVEEAEGAQEGGEIPMIQTPIASPSEDETASSTPPHGEFETTEGEPTPLGNGASKEPVVTPEAIVDTPVKTEDPVTPLNTPPASDTPASPPPLPIDQMPPSTEPEAPPEADVTTPIGA